MLSTDVTEGNKAIKSDPTSKDGQNPLRMNGILLQAKGVTIRTPIGDSILTDISFHIEPGELVALTGVSYSGKSILLQTLAGLVPPASGEILFDGISLYANLKAFRSSIGFVPAYIALPQHLTVNEVIQDGATLRLPRATSKQDCRERILALLETVGLTQVADCRVSSLSRLEKLRLNIAVELLGNPGLMLLDAPTEQLTPFEEIQIAILLKELARKGLTVIQVDTRARSAGMANKTIFLGPGGVLAWFGPTDEAFSFLKGFVPRGVVKDMFGLKEAIEILANPQVEDGVEWAKRFRDHEAYQKYVDDPLHNRYPDLFLQTRPLIRLRSRNNLEEKVPPPIIPRSNAIQKLSLLIRRTVRLLWREKTLLPMLVIPPVVALVDFVFSAATRADPLRASIVLGTLIFLILLTSGLLVQNEIFKERAIYQYENRTTTLLFPYILSKVWLVGMLAVYQGLVWTFMHFLATGMAESPQVLFSFGITIFLVAFTGGMLGLLASAGSKRAMTTTSWLLLFTVPQLILGGSIIPVANLGSPFQLLLVINPARYALEALLVIHGYVEGFRFPPLSDWFALSIIGLCLIALLAVIQQRVGSVRI
jgi:ABC transport system ATP-binding/permease protein